MTRRERESEECVLHHLASFVITGTGILREAAINCSGVVRFEVICDLGRAGYCEYRPVYTRTVRASALVAEIM